MRFFIVMITLFFLCSCNDKQASLSMKKMAEVNRRLESALSPLEDENFLAAHVDNFYSVQSPFSARKRISSNSDPIKLLSNLHWQLAGEVRKATTLLGVFLKSKNRSLYFGVGLPVENLRWRVLMITKNAVVVKNDQKHLYWRIFYSA